MLIVHTLALPWEVLVPTPSASLTTPVPSGHGAALGGCGEHPAPPTATLQPLKPEKVVPRPSWLWHHPRPSWPGRLDRPPGGGSWRLSGRGGSLGLGTAPRTVDHHLCALVPFRGPRGLVAPTSPRRVGATLMPVCRPSDQDYTAVAVRLLGRKPVVVFLDDDGGYLEWLRKHPDGFVVNAARRPRADYLILHRANCHTISGTPARGSRWTTGDYLKACATAQAELRAWARGETKAEPTGCGSCSP